jgi:hypothetical protein
MPEELIHAGNISITMLESLFREALHKASIRNLAEAVIAYDPAQPREVADRQIQEKGLYEVSVEEDERIIVSTTFGTNIIIEPFPSQGILTFIARYRVKPHINYGDILQLANKINSELIVIRASVPEQIKGVIFDYSMYLWGGVTPGSVIVSFQKFEQLVQSTVKANSVYF